MLREGFAGEVFIGQSDFTTPDSSTMQHNKVMRKLGRANADNSHEGGEGGQNLYDSKYNNNLDGENG